MKNFINWIKRDFIGCRANLSFIVGKDVSLKVFIPYYVVMFLLVLPFYPLVKIYVKIQMRKLKRELEET